MQLSFPSLPIDPSGSALSLPTAAADAPTTAPQTAGFAALLAGAAATAGADMNAGMTGVPVVAAPAGMASGTGTATDVAPGVSVALPGIPPGRWLAGSSLSLAIPATDATGSDVVALANSVEPMLPSQPVIARAPVASESGAGRKNSAPAKTLQEQGDVQALVVAVQAMLVPTPPAGAPSTGGTGREGSSPAPDTTAAEVAPALVPQGFAPSRSASPGPTVTSESLPATSEQPVAPSAADEGTYTRIAARISPDGRPAMGTPPRALVSTAYASTGPSAQDGAQPLSREAVAAESQAPVPGDAPASAQDGAQPDALPLGAAESKAATPTSAEVQLARPPVVDANRAGMVAARSSNVPEKFAVETSRSARPLKNGSAVAIKTALTSEGESVAGEGRVIGITSANPAATMPFGATLERQPVTDAVAVHATAALGDAKANASGLLQEVDIPSTAHRAVEAALNATERFAARDQHSVTLQFTVGGSDLHVRVEMRGGEVHTMFRTDSAELRNALSSEWQSVTAQSSGERSVRLADPVFASADGSTSSTSDHGEFRQRQSNAESRQPGFAPTMNSRAAATSTSAVAAAPVIRTTSGNSVHLHTLA